MIQSLEKFSSSLFLPLETHDNTVGCKICHRRQRIWIRNAKKRHQGSDEKWVNYQRRRFTENPLWLRVSRRDGVRGSEEERERGAGEQLVMHSLTSPKWIRGDRKREGGMQEMCPALARCVPLSPLRHLFGSMAVCHRWDIQQPRDTHAVQIYSYNTANSDNFLKCGMSNIQKG